MSQPLEPCAGDDALRGFSGRWRLDRERSVLQIDVPDEFDLRLTVAGASFRLERTLVFGAQRNQFAIELELDGPPTVVARGEARIEARGFRQGEHIAFDSTLTLPSGAGHNRVRYRLADAGRTLIADESFRGPPRDYDNRWVLVRA